MEDLAQLHAQHVRFNFTVNIIDGALFGLGALGFASLVTILPLFMNKLGASPVVIGLVASLHSIGWQLPQLLMANRVSRLERYKPLVMKVTVHERWPILALAFVALFFAESNPSLALTLTFTLLVIYSLGSGFAATAWQAMIGKIIPDNLTATFFGMQSAAANLAGAIGAVAAGALLTAFPYPTNFVICFVIAGASLLISMGFLALTKEYPHVSHPEHHPVGWRPMVAILKRDRNFDWFLVGRLLIAIASVAISFYTIYLVKRFDTSEDTLGVMTAVMTLGQTFANPLFGWLADRYGRRMMYGFGGVLMAASAALAWWGESESAFYLVFVLAGAANASFWAVAISFMLEFGEMHEKPLYIALANTLIGPVSLIAPIVAGSMAEKFGFGSLFALAVVTGVIAWVVVQFVVKDPITLREQAAQTA